MIHPYQGWLILPVDALEEKDCLRPEAVIQRLVLLLLITRPHYCNLLLIQCFTNLYQEFIILITRPVRVSLTTVSSQIKQYGIFNINRQNKA
jgi:hypothetical protein